MMLLESLFRQQQQLNNILDEACNCVSRCSCSDKVVAIREHLQRMQQELEGHLALTKQLSANIQEENTLVNPASEEFEYWNK
jgi:hypothetical protein